jgi:hypothetical protein
MAASMPVAARYARVCSRLTAIVSEDVGGRGMVHLVCLGALEAAGLAFASSPATIILTGFPCRLTSSPPTETDGPSGAAALALGAHRLGAAAAVATDDSSAAVLHACAEAVGLRSTSSPPFELLSFPARAEWSGDSTQRLDGAIRLYRHAIAIERAGAASDGSYRTMRGRVMDALVAPLDVLLTAGTHAGAGGAHTAAAGLVPGLPDWEAGAPAWPSRYSTGIGDGGNEAGMGTVAAAVRAHIPMGDSIGCVTPADALVAVGVSNWGAWAVLAAAEAAIRCGAVAADGSSAGGAAPSPSASAFVLASPPGCLLPSADEERALSAAMCGAGAGDGITGAQDGSVDGMPLSRHLGVLESLAAVLRSEFV